MVSPGQRHIEKRIRIACDWCRRKKTRCPGERPACSACIRAGRDCLYSRRPSNSSGSDQPPAQLATSMHSPDELALEAQAVASDSSRREPAILSDKAIELYFKHVHRQPLWLFDREDLSRDGIKSEDIVLAVLASVSPHLSPCPEPPTYSAACRDAIMAGIARGAVQFSTIQSLCLLTLVNFLAGETQLGSLHLSFSRNLFRCAGSSIPTHCVAASRLSESLHLLEQIYGLRAPEIRPFTGKECHGTGTPSHQLDRDAKTTTSPESCGEAVDDVWTIYAVEMSSIWAQVKDYISRYLDGCDVPPWSPESDYTHIGYALVELEVHFPNAHRFNSVRIWEKSIEELQERRHFYAPWISFQLAYHTARCTLNHPFLHSSRLRKHPAQATPTTFWKACIEKAWLHSNWIAQMIQMLMNKGFETFDPFCALSAAVACSVNLVFCHAVDKRLRYTAQANLEVCTRFIQQRGKHWSLYALLQSKVEALASSADAVSEWIHSSPTISIDASSIKDIYSYPLLGSLASQGWGGVFDLSLRPQPEVTDGDRMMLNVPALNSYFLDIDFSDAGATAPAPAESTVGSMSCAISSAPQESEGTAVQNHMDGACALVDLDLEAIAQGMYTNNVSQPWWSFDI
ncbi:hypothetical protein FOYG_09034 [Fusarium oxysporum NRRL 32931]|uniref:Zn(2)-C6 fungal-type domain-containing protein n=1 Tax=Fusarium oxysporum NRRL 32931 TaxID=660029 RepID=W9IH26_FUSOX|nr:hypothetical protein FOYG_09034 [Fusarium oxysporum NRRL 32931]